MFERTRARPRFLHGRTRARGTMGKINLANRRIVYIASKKKKKNRITHQGEKNENSKKKKKLHVLSDQQFNTIPVAGATTVAVTTGEDKGERR